MIEKAMESLVFKNESVLSLEFVPRMLPHREEKYEFLSRYFRPVITSRGKIASRVLIRGKVGTGKTVLAKRFGKDFEEFARERGINVIYHHVNCRENGTFFNLLRKLIVEFEKFFPKRGYSSGETLHYLLKALDERNVHLIIALDELEALIEKEGPDPLYSLTRYQESRIGPSRISVICIFREPECEKALELVDKSTLSTIELNTIHLEPYKPTELRDILNQRVKEAFREGAVEPETTELISDIADGNARYAIELLRLAGHIADHYRSSRVLPSHVREAQIEHLPGLETDLLSLNLHEKLTLLALARFFEERKERGYMTMGELVDHYRIVCEEHKVKPLGYTQFWKSLRQLSYRGILSTKISGEGYKGKTSLISLLVRPDRLKTKIEKGLAR